MRDLRVRGGSAGRCADASLLTTMFTRRAGSSSPPSPATRDNTLASEEEWPSDEEEDASYSDGYEDAPRGDAVTARSPQAGSDKDGESQCDEDGESQCDEDDESESDGDYTESGSDQSSEESDIRSSRNNEKVARSSAAPPASSPSRPPATPAPAADLSSIIAFLTHVLGSQHQLEPEEHASLQRFWVALMDRLDAQQAQARLGAPAAGSPAVSVPTPRRTAPMPRRRTPASHHQTPTSCRRAPSPAAIQSSAPSASEAPMTEPISSDIDLTSLLQRLLEQQSAPSAPTQLPPPPLSRTPSPIERLVVHQEKPTASPTHEHVDIHGKPPAPSTHEHVGTDHQMLPAPPPLPPIPPPIPLARELIPPLVPPMGLLSPSPPSGGGVGLPFALMDLESDDEQDPDFDPQQVVDQAGPDDWLWDPRDLQADLAALMEDVPSELQHSNDDISPDLAQLSNDDTSPALGLTTIPTKPSETRPQPDNEGQPEVAQPPLDPPVVKRGPGRPRKYATHAETIAAQRKLTRERRRQEKTALTDLRRELSDTKDQLDRTRKDVALQASHVRRLIMHNSMLLHQIDNLQRHLAARSAPPGELSPFTVLQGLKPPQSSPPMTRRRPADAPAANTRSKRTRRHS